MRIGFVPAQNDMATLDADTRKIRLLRTQRAWSQEQLAEIAGISYRTVQRIESSGKASFESIRAIASAFNVDVNDLLRKPERPASPTRRSEPVPSFLIRVLTGKDLFSALGGCHAGRFDNDELRSQEEVDLVGAFMQDMRDYLDIWDDIEPAHRVQAMFDYTERIKELERAGFWVFARREREPIRSGKHIIEDWQVATIAVMRADNPLIIRFPPDKESVATNPSGESKRP